MNHNLKYGSITIRRINLHDDNAWTDVNTCLSGRIAKLPAHNKGVLIVPMSTAHSGPCSTKTDFNVTLLWNQPTSQTNSSTSTYKVKKGLNATICAQDICGGSVFHIHVLYIF